MDYISQLVLNSDRPKMQASIIRYAKGLPSVQRIQVGNFHIEICGEYNLRRFGEMLKEASDHNTEALMSHDAYPKE